MKARFIVLGSILLVYSLYSYQKTIIDEKLNYIESTLRVFTNNTTMGTHEHTCIHTRSALDIYTCGLRMQSKISFQGKEVLFVFDYIDGDV